VPEDDERRRLPPEQGLREALARDAPELLLGENSNESAAAAAASRRAQRRDRNRSPQYENIPARCIADATVLRELAPAVTDPDALPPPRAPCIYGADAARPPRPLVPEALAHVDGAEGSASGASARDSFLRARVEGTAFDRASVRGMACVDDLDSMPSFVLGEGAGGGGSGEDPMCVICRDEKEPGDLLRLLPCGHAWHVRCVDAWLLIDARCPLCLRPCGRTRGEESSEHAQGN
jgi:hypothetical protein